MSKIVVVFDIDECIANGWDETEVFQWTDVEYLNAWFQIFKKNKPDN